MKVLVACEFSGIVRDAFKVKGHDAWSCDLLPCEGDKTYHIQGNILKILNDGWDLMIAHPPCTRLCNSGVRWLAERNLWLDLNKAAMFFRHLLYSRIEKVAIENPIPHKYALHIIQQKYDQIIQPWQFGHGETKATCLWLRNLPKLKPTNIVDGRKQRIFNMPKNADRGRLRSITFQGIANAMAEQWG